MAFWGDIITTHPLDDLLVRHSRRCARFHTTTKFRNHRSGGLGQTTASRSQRKISENLSLYPPIRNNRIATCRRSFVANVCCVDNFRILGFLPPIHNTSLPISVARHCNRYPANPKVATTIPRAIKIRAKIPDDSGTKSGSGPSGHMVSSRSCMWRVAGRPD